MNRLPGNNCTNSHTSCLAVVVGSATRIAQRPLLVWRLASARCKLHSTPARCGRPDSIVYTSSAARNAAIASSRRAVPDSRSPMALRALARLFCTAAHCSGTRSRVCSLPGAHARIAVRNYELLLEGMHDIEFADWARFGKNPAGKFCPKRSRFSSI
jgi:hypothetical protein